jgi:hypothetical protein
MEQRPRVDVHEGDVELMLREAESDVAYCFWVCVRLAERSQMLSASEPDYRRACARWARSVEYRLWAERFAEQAEREGVSLLESAWAEKGRVVAR